MGRNLCYAFSLVPAKTALQICGGVAGSEVSLSRGKMKNDSALAFPSMGWLPKELLKSELHPGPDRSKLDRGNKGGKFDIFQLIVYMGSTISYFGLATVLIDYLIQMYTKNCCRSWFYPCCKVCEPCSVNEYYYDKKYEIVGQPKSRPQKDFTDLAKLSPPPHPDPSLSPAASEEMQCLKEEPGSPSPARPEWCFCGQCHPSQLPESSKFIEELCCHRKEGPCITTSAVFEELVLSRATLHFSLLYQEPLLEMDADDLNDRLRHCAYRRYIDWHFGSEDMAGFAILPSCCRWKIREQFPKKDGKYTGFRSSKRYNWKGKSFSHHSFNDSCV